VIFFDQIRQKIGATLGDWNSSRANEKDETKSVSSSTSTSKWDGKMCVSSKKGGEKFL
jgi:hypothetical protein